MFLRISIYETLTVSLLFSMLLSNSQGFFIPSATTTQVIPFASRDLILGENVENTSVSCHRFAFGSCCRSFG
jgi:hypothetical protein